MEESYRLLCDSYAKQHAITKQQSKHNITYSQASGVHCKKCHGTFVRQVDEKQLRSADEGSTLFFECERCLFITKVNT